MKDLKILFFSVCLISIQDTLIGMNEYCQYRLNFQHFSNISVGDVPCDFNERKSVPWFKKILTNTTLKTLES